MIVDVVIVIWSQIEINEMDVSVHRSLGHLREIVEPPAVRIRIEHDDSLVSKQCGKFVENTFDASIVSRETLAAKKHIRPGLSKRNRNGLLGKTPKCVRGR